MLRGRMAEARTEQASPDRLARARERGDAPVSRGLTAAAALGAFFAVASAQASGSLAAWQGMLRGAFSATPNSQLELTQALGATARLAAAVLWAPLLAACAAALVAGLAQSGGLWAVGALRGDFDPMARLRALFAPDRALDAASRLIAVLALMVVAGYTLVPSLPGILALPGGALSRALQLLSELGSTLVLRLVVTAIALGLCDWAVRRVRQRMRLAMSRRELIEEQREQYGDPHLRAERTRRARSGPATRGAP
jgi:flagellar biosynthesis protein FlhB